MFGPDLGRLDAMPGPIRTYNLLTNAQRSVAHTQTTSHSTSKPGLSAELYICAINLPFFLSRATQCLPYSGYRYTTSLSSKISCRRQYTEDDTILTCALVSTLCHTLRR